MLEVLEEIKQCICPKRRYRGKDSFVKSVWLSIEGINFVYICEFEILLLKCYIIPSLSVLLLKYSV